MRGWVRERRKARTSESAHLGRPERRKRREELTMIAKRWMSAVLVSAIAVDAGLGHGAVYPPRVPPPGGGGGGGGGAPPGPGNTGPGDTAPPGPVTGGGTGPSGP